MLANTQTFYYNVLINGGQTADYSRMRLADMFCVVRLAE